MHYTKASSSVLREEEENNKTERNKASHDNPVPPLLCRYPSDQRIDPRYLACRVRNPPIDTRQGFTLQIKVVINCVRLAENTVHHIVAIVDTIALFQHVISLGSFRVVLAVFIDIRADIGQKVRPIARLL